MIPEELRVFSAAQGALERKGDAGNNGVLPEKANDLMAVTGNSSNSRRRRYNSYLGEYGKGGVLPVFSVTFSARCSKTQAFRTVRRARREKFAPVTVLQIPIYTLGCSVVVITL